MTVQQVPRAGFTLVEVLVVIAITLVLAALVFVGVGRAREAASSAVCMNNMRQVAAEHVKLCQENNGIIVHVNRTSIGGGPARPWPLHHAALFNDHLDWKSPYNEINEAVEKMKHLQCPTAYRLKKKEMDRLSGRQKVSTYSMNGLIGSDFDPDNGPNWIVGAKTLAEILNPSELVLAIEKEWHPSWYYGLGAGGAATVHVFGEFHNGGFNVAFYDGHVERGVHGDFPIWTKKDFKWGNEEFSRYWWGKYRDW